MFFFCYKTFEKDIKPKHAVCVYQNVKQENVLQSTIVLKPEI